MSKSLLMSITLILSLSLSVMAATPTVMNYQGRITNTSGDPVSDGLYSVAFTIYDAAAGGDSKWTEIQNVTTTDGLFAVLLGAVNPIIDSVFADTNRYLGIAIAGDPELMPRTFLASVAYAYRVSGIDGAQGGAITGDLKISGRAIIGTGHGTIGTEAFVAGGLNTASGAYSAISGGEKNEAAGDHSFTVGYADSISSSGDYSVLFGINSKLTEDSTFMVDMPHIRIGNENTGYELPTSDGSSDQVMTTDGSGQASWSTISTSDTWNWSDSSSHGPDSVLFADISGVAVTVNDNAINSNKIADGSIQSNDISNNAVVSAKIGTDAVTSVKIKDNSILEADLAYDPATQTELNSHQSIASTHHTKTTNASELTSGLLNDNRLSSRVALEYNSNVFTGTTNSFSGTLKVGDSTFQANNSGIRIGDDTAPSSSYLIRAERNYNTSSTRYGYYATLKNQSTGALYGMRVNLGASTDAGGVRYGIYSDVLNSLTASQAIYGVRIVAGHNGKTAGTVYGLRASVHAGTPALAYGIYASETGLGFNYAGWFDGIVHVNGNLSKSSGSFKIDHPLDPANKYLQHSFVESPDMMNIYNGNVVTDGSGYALVTLPEWFEVLNMEFRYQLTVIGVFAQAIISEELHGNTFSILTDKPQVKVSWQVTGIRNDKYAQAHRIQVEVDKPAHELGTYLNPEERGQSIEKHVNWEQIKEDLDREERKE